MQLFQKKEQHSRNKVFQFLYKVLKEDRNIHFHTFSFIG